MAVLAASSRVSFLLCSRPSRGSAPQTQQPVPAVRHARSVCAPWPAPSARQATLGFSCCRAAKDDGLSDYTEVKVDSVRVSQGNSIVYLRLLSSENLILQVHIGAWMCVLVCARLRGAWLWRLAVLANTAACQPLVRLAAGLQWWVGLVLLHFKCVARWGCGAPLLQPGDAVDTHSSTHVLNFRCGLSSAGHEGLVGCGEARWAKKHQAPLPWAATSPSWHSCCCALARTLPDAGEHESSALLKEISKGRVLRPLTHDLTKQLLSAVGYRVTKIRITDMVSNTYYARVHVARVNALVSGACHWPNLCQDARSSLQLWNTGLFLVHLRQHVCSRVGASCRADPDVCESARVTCCRA
jgi:hypothetical protein